MFIVQPPILIVSLSCQLWGSCPPPLWRGRKPCALPHKHPLRQSKIPADCLRQHIPVSLQQAGTTSSPSFASILSAVLICPPAAEHGSLVMHSSNILHSFCSSHPAVVLCHPFGHQTVPVFPLPPAEHPLSTLHHCCWYSVPFTCK